MKKILIIGTSLIAFWAISTSVIGNKTKENIKHYIEKSNKVYANSGVHLRILDYEKSFLNSTAKIEIDLLDPQVKKAIKKDFAFPITLDYTIQHGPIFFQKGIGFGLSKIESELSLSSLLKDKSQKEFLSLIKEDVTLNTEMLLSFSKKLNYTIRNRKEITINQDKKEFFMTPFTLVGTTNVDTLKGNGTLNIQKLTLREANSSNGLELNNLVAEATIDDIFKETLFFGEFKLAVGNLIINDDTNPNLKQINLSLDGTMKNQRVDDDTMNSILKSTIYLGKTQLETMFKELDKINISMEMHQLGIEGMYQFQKITQEFQQKRNKLIQNLYQKEPTESKKVFDELQKLDMEVAETIMPTLNKMLLKDKTTLAYTIDVKTKESASSSASVKIGYAGDVDFTKPIKELEGEIKAKLLSLLSLNLNIKLNKKHLPMLPIPMLEQQIQMGIAQGMIKENNSSYLLDGYYKDKELIVNDNNLTSTILPLLMMFTTQ